MEEGRESNSLLFGVSIGAILATFVLITMGGVVRVTESGLGCPDWPLCYGEIIPPMEFHTMIEYSHRLLANVVSIFVFALLIIALLKYRRVPRILRTAVLIVVLLGVQIGLGAWTVLAELPPEVVTAHLAVALAIFSLLVFTAVVTFGQRGRFSSAAVNPGTYRDWWLPASMAAAVYLVVLSGSYVVGSNATYACVSWPFCQNLDFVKWDQMLSFVNMFHRVIAAILLAIIIRVVMVLWKRYAGLKSFRVIGIALIVVVIGEIGLGAANPLMEFNAFVRAAHLSVATMIQGLVVALTSLVWIASRTIEGRQ